MKYLTLVANSLYFKFGLGKRNLGFVSCQNIFSSIRSSVAVDIAECKIIVVGVSHHTNGCFNLRLWHHFWKSIANIIIIIINNS